MTLVLDDVHQTFEFEVAWLGVYDRVHHQLLTRGYHSPPHLPLHPHGVTPDPRGCDGTSHYSTAPPDYCRSAK